MRITGLPAPLFPVITHAASRHLMTGNLHSLYKETLRQLEFETKGSVMQDHHHRNVYSSL